jgi:peroxiredoxin
VRHQFTVPEMPGGRSDQPLDLGEIEVILNDELKPGDRAPDFEVGMLSGETIRLSDLRGKYVVLDFQSGVPPTSTTAYFNALYRQYAGHPQFAFIGLAMGEHVDAIREVLSQQEIPWAQGVLEAESKVIADYDLDGIPQTLLIAPDGTVLRRGIGSGELERELQSRLGRSD